MGIPRDRVKHLIERLEQKPKKKIPKSRYRSKAEATYAEKLEVQKRAGEIVDWGYEAMTFVIGRTETGRAWRYTPDFMVVKRILVHESYRSVIPHVEVIEFHEVKGKHRGTERGIAKFRAAQALFPWFKWVLIER